MTSEPIFITSIYLIVSLAGFLFFFFIPRRFSGVNFTHGRYWLFFALVMPWATNQLSVARYGYLLSFMPAIGFFENDYIVRWVAFITAIAQTFFFPSRKEPKRWFLRK
ncbi:hypothetical protein ICA16_04680 [Pseudomonas anatoliensis]|uniref:hypothetical protein n=1 Tax=Pseudomonas anatoliensis TaxID=2710589 RepID=UPI001B321EE2|nr:hypothetical protein [Pseudomonas anatoliensis]MBP5954953.1 hypothetical protein [Pseudomonas anatoliensis]